MRWFLIALIALILGCTDEPNYVQPYSDIDPIHFRDRNLHLTLRCSTSDKPEALLIVRSGNFLSKPELEQWHKKILDSENKYIHVQQIIDKEIIDNELWEIDISGKIAISPTPLRLIEKLKNAHTYLVEIKTNSYASTSQFNVKEKIPYDWRICP